MVAPNSPSARAQLIAAPASSEGDGQRDAGPGKRTRGAARRVAAASRYFRSTSAKPARAAATKNGAATNACATTTPSVVKGRVMPERGERPAGQARPAEGGSNATPATVGGSTIGRSMNDLQRPLAAEIRVASR